MVIADIGDLVVNDVFSPGEKVFEFDTIPLPGHTYGHVGFTFRNDVIYVGDSVFGLQLLGRVKVPFYLDHGKYVNTIAKLKTFIKEKAFRYVVLSHGPILSDIKAFDEIANGNLSYVLRFEDAVKSIMSSYTLTVDELTSQVLLKLGIEQSITSYYLTQSSIKALIETLMDSGEVRNELVNGQVKWRLG